MQERGMELLERVHRAWLRAHDEGDVTPVLSFALRGEDEDAVLATLSDAVALDAKLREAQREVAPCRPGCLVALNLLQDLLVVLDCPSTKEWEVRGAMSAFDGIGPAAMWAAFTASPDMEKLAPCVDAWFARPREPVRYYSLRDVRAALAACDTRTYWLSG